MSKSVKSITVLGGCLKVGNKVMVSRNPNSWLNKAIWWPTHNISGAVTRICKNGSVYVAQDQFPNMSEDGLRTRVFSVSDDVTITIIHRPCDNHDWR